MPALVSDESQEVKAGWPSSTLESRLLSSPGHAPPEKITPVSPILQKFRQQLQHPWWTALGFLSALALYLALQGPNSWLHLDTGHIWKAEHQTQERLSNELPTVHLCGDSTMAVCLLLAIQSYMRLLIGRVVDRGSHSWYVALCRYAKHLLNTVRHLQATLLGAGVNSFIAS